MPDIGRGAQTGSQSLSLMQWDIKPQLKPTNHLARSLRLNVV